MSISIIAAVSKNNVIGIKNELPWYLPEDLKRFKNLTLKKTVLMGRKTFESILAKIGKPLPDRKNVVITRNKNFKAPQGVLIFDDIKKALNNFKNEDIFIIGGGKIYQQTINLADTLYITHIDKEIKNGDTFFPEIDEKIWQKISQEDKEGFSFAVYQRKKSC
jgi:dihydrofolate reductase